MIVVVESTIEVVVVIVFKVRRVFKLLGNSVDPVNENNVVVKYSRVCVITLFLMLVTGFLVATSNWLNCPKGSDVDVIIIVVVISWPHFALIFIVHEKKMIIN